MKYQTIGDIKWNFLLFFNFFSQMVKRPRKKITTEDEARRVDDLVQPNSPATLTQFNCDLKNGKKKVTYIFKYFFIPTKGVGSLSDSHIKSTLVHEKKGTRTCFE